jgi:acylphosphatase
VARDLGLQGSAVNLVDGEVAVVVEGPRAHARRCSPHSTAMTRLGMSKRS